MSRRGLDLSVKNSLIITIAFGILIILGVSFSANSAQAAPAVRTLEPALTSSLIFKATSPHQIVIDPWVKANGYLVITIGGTGSKTTEFSYVQQLAASRGYHVLGIDYFNQVISTTCQTNTDSLCFDKYRNENVTGAAVSPLVNINPANALVNRIDKLIRYMSNLHPDEGWPQYLTPNGAVDWSRVILIGHSQGAGHVAYMSKIFKLRGIVMMSGPHDKWSGGLADWVTRVGKTPVDRLFAFFHKEDFFGCALQTEVARGMIGDSEARAEAIKRAIPAESLSQIFITDVPAADPHNSLAQPEFELVWTSIFSRLTP